jgi:hypothetical protein
MVHELTSLLISRHKVLKQVSSINMTCVRCDPQAAGFLAFGQVMVLDQAILVSQEGNKPARFPWQLPCRRFEQSPTLPATVAQFFPSRSV